MLKVTSEFVEPVKQLFIFIGLLVAEISPSVTCDHYRICNTLSMPTTPLKLG